MRKWLAILALMSLWLCPAWAENGKHDVSYLLTTVHGPEETALKPKQSPEPGGKLRLHLKPKEGSNAVVIAAFEGRKLVSGFAPQLQILPVSKDEIELSWPGARGQAKLFLLFLDGKSPDLPGLRELVRNATRDPVQAGPALYQQIAERHNSGLSRGGTKPQIVGGVMPTSASHPPPQPRDSPPQGGRTNLMMKFDWLSLAQRAIFAAQEHRVVIYRFDRKK